jgi:putative PIG3 family NAD(P)H quinone oxidoreductase
MQRDGKYPPPKGESEIPGLELSGDVIEVGAKVTAFKPGDRIYGLVGSGAYAQYCAVEASLAHLIPKNWDYRLAAALPESLVTNFATLFDIGKLKSNQTLLIHGAGSGITSLAIQMAKYTNSTVISTVGDSTKMAKAKSLGASHIINYNEQDFEDLIEEQSVDLIVDFIGADYFNRHLHLLKPKGQLIQIACLKGNRVDCNLTLIMRNRLSIIGFVLRSQSLTEKALLWKLAHQQWLEPLQKQVIKPIIDSEFAFADIELAHERMKSGKNFGKIVINIDS